MQRVLMRLGISQLEEMFTKSKSDMKVLQQLEHELQCRQTPRAKSLLVEVQAVTKKAEVLPPVVNPVPPSKRIESPLQHPEPLPRPFAELPPISVTKSRPLPALLAMSPEEAYGVLKATPGSTWESIEQTRRLLVQQASPTKTASMDTDRRERLQIAARRVNAAYMVLARHRTGSL